MRRAGTGCAVVLALVSFSGCDGLISDEAASVFRARTEPASITVYPVQVARGSEVEHDATLAAQVVAVLESEALAVARVAEAPIEIPLTWRRNQARMAGDAAAAFGLEITKLRGDADYALFAQVLFNSDETAVVGVHYFLADRAGRIAGGALLNAHHRQFRKVEPRNRADAMMVLQSVLREDLQR